MKVFAADGTLLGKVESNRGIFEQVRPSASSRRAMRLTVSSICRTAFPGGSLTYRAGCAGPLDALKLGKDIETVSSTGINNSSITTDRFESHTSTGQIDPPSTSTFRFSGLPSFAFSLARHRGGIVLGGGVTSKSCKKVKGGECRAASVFRLRRDGSLDRRFGEDGAALLP
jgi:hypothetical protein